MVYCCYLLDVGGPRYYNTKYYLLCSELKRADCTFKGPKVTSCQPCKINQCSRVSRSFYMWNPSLISLHSSAQEARISELTANLSDTEADMACCSDWSNVGHPHYLFFSQTLRRQIFYSSPCRCEMNVLFKMSQNSWPLFNFKGPKNACYTACENRV